MSELPVLDLSHFRSADRDAFLDELRRAAREVGFFTVVGHGIDPELTARLDDEVRRFFALPIADRLSIENTASPHFRGYYGENALVGWLRSHPTVAARHWS